MCCSCMPHIPIDASLTAKWLALVGLIVPLALLWNRRTQVANIYSHLNRHVGIDHNIMSFYVVIFYPG